MSSQNLYLKLTVPVLLAFFLLLIAPLRAELAFENRTPYVSLNSLKKTINVGERQTLNFYVTDYENRDYRFNDRSEKLTVSFSIDGVHYQNRTVRGGDHTITLPVFTTPKSEVRLAIQVTDSQGRKSHVLYQNFRVVDPVTHPITAGQTYSPTTVDLFNSFGIYSNDTNPVATTSGLNNMLVWAGTNGYRKVILPTGIYRIDENSTVKMVTGMTLDLNGSTLRLNPSSLDKGYILEIAHCVDSHVENGTIEGDLDNHNFSVSPNSEWLVGILLGQGAEYCSFENLVVKKITGYGVATSFEYARRPVNVGISHNPPKSVGAFTLGEIDETTGLLVPSTTRTACNTAVDISTYMGSKGFFQLGKYLGYQGNPLPDNWIYRAAFYDVSNNYIGSTLGHFYRRMYPPANARYAKFTLYSATALPNDSVSLFNIRTPYNCDLIDLDIQDVRCVGMVPSGFHNLTVTGCTFNNVGWAMAKCAFDAEDGWDLMQDLYFHDNVFGTNPVNEFVAFAGHNFVVERNVMGYYSTTRSANFVVRDNVFKKATFDIGPYKTMVHFRVYNNDVLGETRLAITHNLIWLDREYCIKNNNLYGGAVSHNTDPTTFKFGYFYQCDILGGPVRSRLVDCNVNGAVASTNRFSLERCYVENSTFLTANMTLPSEVVESEVVNSSFRLQKTTLNFRGCTLTNTTVETGAWSPLQEVHLEGNTITTSGTKFLTVTNDFNRISFHNNVVNSSNANFRAINLANPTNSNTSIPVVFWLSMNGNTFNANGGTALAASWAVASNVDLKIGMGNNVFNSITSHSTILNGKPNVFFLTPPSVALTAPLNGTSTPAPGSLSFVAAASGSGATIDKVEFFDRAGNKLGEDLTSPYSLSLSDIPAGEYTFVAQATDSNGCVAVSAPSAVTVQKATIPGEILFVTGTPVPNAEDAALKLRMENLGYNVTVIDDGAVVLNDAIGKDLLVISSSSSPAIGSTFSLCEVPILCWGGSIYPSLGMTGATAAVDYGITTGATNVTISNPADSLAAGLSGTVALTSAPTDHAWGIPLPSAQTVAEIAGVPGKAGIFSYEMDAGLLGLIAPSRRVAFPLANGATLGTDGYLLFDAAVKWTAGDL